jgi:hypothetical protein
MLRGSAPDTEWSEAHELIVIADQDETPPEADETTIAKHRELVDEIRSLIQERSRAMLARIDMELAFPIPLKSRAVEWVLRAHRGTLEKFLGIYAFTDASRPVELVALSRNLFENLIWLRLFDKDGMYGLAFYRQLLEAQLESQKQAIEKAREEVELFKKADLLDTPDFSRFDHILKKDHPTNLEIAEIRDAMKRQSDEVDAMVRNSFSLYAEQAKHNGYGFQAHLIESKAIPHHEQRIRTLEEHLNVLKDEWINLPTELQKDFDKRWNWHERAQSVGMQGHYRFLYSFTSKMLHSTPMSLVTPKTLSGQEVLMLLEYLRIGISESRQLIEKFSYPGKLSVMTLGS